MKRHTTRKRTGLAALLMIGCTLASTSFIAQDHQAETLRGLAGLTIIVDPLPPAVIQVGVTKEVVIADIDRLLRRGGVTVNDSTMGAQLSVTVNAVQIRRGSGSTSGIAYTLAVSLEQEATLTATGQTASVTTWRHAGIGVVSVAKAHAAIREQLAEYVEQFIVVYRSVNRR